MPPINRRTASVGPSRRRFLGCAAGAGLALCGGAAGAQPVTGADNPYLAPFDQLMTSFVREQRVPGADPQGGGPADKAQTVFFDDFSGPGLDRAKWNVEVTGPTYNDEQQAYVDSTDTVHVALRAVIDRAARERLAERDFADLHPDVLEQVRRPRQFA